MLAEFGEHFTAEHHILRAELAGGPLLDLGTYPSRSPPGSSAPRPGPTRP
ncbi:hypothetical protein [Streptomyces sp. NPDC001530]